MSEKLELVTDFATLRAGMIVVVKNCRICSRSHRGMLVSYTEEPGFCGSARPDRSPSWKAVPTCDCAPSHHQWMGISRDAVNQRRVFRGVDGLEQTTEARKSVTA